MKIDPDEYHFYGYIPSSHRKVIQELEQVTSDTDFIRRMAEIHSWSEFDNEQTDLKAWVNVLNRIDIMFEQYIKYNSTGIIVVPFAHSDSGYAEELTRTWKERRKAMTREFEFKEPSDVRGIVEISLTFLKLLIGNARSREVFNSVEYLREFFGCECERIEYLALEVLFELVKIPESHTHVEERDEEIETTAQVDLGLSKLLLCFAQGYGSKSQRLDLRSLVTKPTGLLPVFPGSISYDFYRTGEPKLKPGVKELLDEISPFKKASKRSKAVENGLVRIVINSEDLMRSETCDLFKRIVRKYQLPRKIYFSFLQRLRMAKSFLTKEGRIRRTRMRLLSLGILFKICSNADLMPAYITHEPELTAEIVDLITGVSPEKLRNGIFDEIPFDIKIIALKVLQRLPGSSMEISGVSGSLSAVGKNSNVLQHLGVMKGQANGLLSNYIRSLCLDIDKYFPLQCPEKALTVEESKSQNSFFRSPEEELCFAFGLTFASAACDTEYDELTMDYARKVFEARDAILNKKNLNARLRDADELFEFYENILLLCGEVTGTQQGAVLLATTGVMNNYSLILRKEVDERRKLNDAFSENLQRQKFHLNFKRTKLLSQIVFTLSALIAISSFALSLAQELELASIVLCYVEEIVLKAISENVPRRSEKRSRRSKTKKARNKRRKSGEVDFKYDSAALSKESTRLKPYSTNVFLLRDNCVEMSEKVLLRNLIQFLVILVQRSNEQRRPSFNIKEENSKLIFIFKLMFRYNNIFGAANFNMLATLFTEVVNFEPSCIYNVYRNEIHTIIASHIKANKIPDDAQSKCCLPNLLSAFCLHSEGEKFLKKEKVVPSLMDQLLKPELLYNCTQVKQNLETNECEEVYEMCAHNLDHFLRNHKSFRNQVLQRFLTGIKAICGPSIKAQTFSIEGCAIVRDNYRDIHPRNRIKLLFGSLKLFSLLVKNKDVVDILYEIPGAIDHITHCYLVTLCKSSEYLFRTGNGRIDRSATKALTDLLSCLMYHEKFPFVIVSKLKSTLKKLVGFDLKASKGNSSFRPLSHVHKSLLFMDVRSFLYYYKHHNIPDEAGILKGSWRHSARLVKSLGYVEWLISLLLHWMAKISKTQNFRRKVATLYNVLSTKEDGDLTGVLSELLEISLKIVQEKIYFREALTTERTSWLRSQASEEKVHARSLRFVVSLELHRFNRIILRFLIKVHDIFNASNRNAFPVVNLVQAYDLFLTNSMSQVTDTILRGDVWLEGIQALYYRAQKLGVLTCMMLGETSAKPHVLLAYRMFKNGVLSRFVREGVSIFTQLLDLYDQSYQNFSSQQEVENFLELSEKIVYDISQLFDCLRMIATASDASTVTELTMDMTNILKNFWENKDSFKDDFELEISHYPFSGTAFSLQLRLILAVNLEQLISNEKIGLLGLFSDTNEKYSGLFGFFAVIERLRKSFDGTTESSLFPENLLFELTVNTPVFETFEEFHSKFENRIKSQESNNNSDKSDVPEAFVYYSDGFSSNADAKRLQAKDALILNRSNMIDKFMKCTKEGYSSAVAYLVKTALFNRNSSSLVAEGIPSYATVDPVFHITGVFYEVIEKDQKFFATVIREYLETPNDLGKAIVATVFTKTGKYVDSLKDLWFLLYEENHKRLKQIVSSYAGDVSTWKVTMDLCPILLGLLNTIKNDAEKLTDRYQKLNVSALNLLKVINKVQTKKLLFTSSQILALISLWTMLLKNPKSKEFFVRNDGIAHLFQLRVSSKSSFTHDLVTRLFMELFSNNTLKAQQFKQVLKTAFIEAKNRARGKKVCLGTLKSTIVFLYNLDKDVLLNSYLELFSKKMQNGRVLEDEKTILLDTIGKDFVFSTNEKSNKKNGNLNTQIFKATITQLVKMLKKDLLQDTMTKKKKKNVRRVMDTMYVMESFLFQTTHFPFDVERMFNSPIEQTEIRQISSDMSSQYLNSVFSFEEPYTFYAFLVKTVLPVNFIFKRVDVPHSHLKEENDVRIHTFSKILELLPVSSDITELAVSNTVYILIGHMASMLKSLVENSVPEKPKRSVRTAGREVPVTINRMWAITGYLEEILIMLSRSKMKGKSRKIWNTGIKKLFEYDMIRLLIKSLNILVPYHSKFFQCVGTILTLLDTMTKPNTLRWVKPMVANDDLDKPLPDFVDSVEDYALEAGSESSLVLDDIEEEDLVEDLVESNSEFSDSLADYDEDISEMSGEDSDEIMEETVNLELLADTENELEEGLDGASSAVETTTQMEDEHNTSTHEDANETGSSNQPVEPEVISETDTTTNTTTSTNFELEHSSIFAEDIRSLGSEFIPVQPIVRHLREQAGATSTAARTNVPTVDIGNRGDLRRNNIFALLEASENIDMDNAQFRQGMQNSFRTVLHSLLQERRLNRQDHFDANFNITFGRGIDNVSFSMNIAEAARNRLYHFRETASQATNRRIPFDMINQNLEGMSLPGISAYFIPKSKLHIPKYRQKSEDLLLNVNHELLESDTYGTTEVLWKDFLLDVKQKRNARKHTNKQLEGPVLKKAKISPKENETDSLQNQASNYESIMQQFTSTSNRAFQDQQGETNLDGENVADDNTSGDDEGAEVDETATHDSENMDVEDQESSAEIVATAPAADDVNVIEEGGENETTQTQESVLSSSQHESSSLEVEQLVDFITGLGDITLRREVFLSLTTEQINSLPDTLQAESQLYRQHAQPPTTFIPATTAGPVELQLPHINQVSAFRPTTSISTETSRSRRKKTGIALEPEVTGFEDIVGEKEVESLMKLFFHLRQGKKVSHKNVLFNLCEHSLFREIILCKIFQLIEPDLEYLTFVVKKVVQRSENSFKLSFRKSSTMSREEKIKAKNDKKWCPVKMIGTSETIFTRYASQLQPIHGFIPFLAFRRVLEALRFICNRSKRVCILLLEREGALEFLTQLLSVKEYFANVKFLSIMVEIIVHIVSPVNHFATDIKNKDLKLYYPKARILEKKYFGYILTIFGSSSCSEEIFVKLKAPLRQLAIIKENCENILVLASQEASVVGSQAINELARASSVDPFYNRPSAELKFFRLLRVIKDVAIRNMQASKEHLALLNIDLRGFLDGFVHSIKRYAKSSALMFSLKRALSLSDLGLGDKTPKAIMSVGSFPISTSFVQKAVKSPVTQRKKTQVHSMALALAQTKLTMFKCFLIVCYIQGKHAEPMLIEFVHRFKNVLNSLIQQNASLLESDFKTILIHPKCKHAIDFHNKRQYFRNQVRKLKSNKRGVRLQVRRSYVYADSYNNLASKSRDDMLGKLSVQFLNEEGVDAGGVAREYYQILCRQMFDPSYCLFSASSDSAALQPDSRSQFAENHLQNFQFIGRMVGKAILEGILIDAHFTRSFYKHILGLPIDYRDIDSIDPQYYKSLCDLLVMKIEDLGFDLTFTTDEKEFGVVKTVELKPNGRNIKVTDENKMEYVQLCTLHKMTTGIREQIEAFLKGFHEIVPLRLISIFNEQELELLICGVPEVDLEDLRNNTEYLGYTSESIQVKWFWKVINNWPKEDHAKFLMFVTGTSKVPLGGFKNLVGMRGTQKFSIHKSFKNDQILPSAHTCFNQFDLPEYSSEKILREKLSYAVKEGGEGFGFR